MKYLYSFVSILPFYVYLLFGSAIIIYKILDLHIEYRNKIKKLEPGQFELKSDFFKDFKKKSILVILVVGIFAIVLAILSFGGAKYVV